MSSRRVRTFHKSVNGRQRMGESGGDWQESLLARAKYYLGNHWACRDSVTVLKAEVIDAEVVFQFVCAWLDGPIGLRVSPEVKLPMTGFTSTDERGLSLVESDLDDVAFDIAVLLMCEPFGPDAVGSPDNAGVRWMRLPGGDISARGVPE